MPCIKIFITHWKSITSQPWNVFNRMFAHVISVIKLLVPSSEFTFEKKYFQAGMDQIHIDMANISDLRDGHIRLWIITPWNVLDCNKNDFKPILLTSFMVSLLQVSIQIFHLEITRGLYLKVVQGEKLCPINVKVWTLPVSLPLQIQTLQI